MPDLKRFPRPSVAVDVAVLTVAEQRLAVVVWRRTGATHHGQWALPGSFVRARERLADAVQRTLEDKCAIRGLAPTQLQVMDDPDRDDRGWVLSVAYLDVVVAASLDLGTSADDVALAPVRPEHRSDGRPTARRSRGRARSILELPDGQRALPFDHEAIVARAITTLRDRYAERPDPAGLLGPRFTMLDLRRLHEAIADEPLQKDTFRRAMLMHLEQLDAVTHGTVGRPARLFAHRVPTQHLSSPRPTPRADPRRRHEPIAEPDQRR